MKRFAALAICFAVSSPVLAAPIDISTGVADWQVSISGSLVPVTSVSPNGAWAPAPTGASWE